MQGDEGGQVQDPVGLRIERASPVHVAVPHLTGQRIGCPEPPIGGDDVHVMQEDERGAVAPFEARPDVAAPGSRLDDLVADPLSLEDLRKEPGACDLVPRRVHRVDANVALKPRDRFVLQRAEIDLCPGGQGYQEAHDHGRCANHGSLACT